MMTVIAPRRQRRRPLPGFSREQLPFLIILLPFGLYLEVIDEVLHPILHPDAFAYLWEGPLTRWYFLGRSLSLRLLYSLAGNAPETIIRLQLLVFLLSTLALYHCLRYRRWWADLLLATGLAYLFSSYDLTLIAVVVAPEAWAIGIGLLCAALCFAPPGRGRTVLTLITGIALIFSRNLGPFVMLMLLVCHYALGWRRDWRQPLWLGATLLVIALTSMVLTQCFDRTVHVNTLNNLYTRVFPSADHTRLFVTDYGMPDGPFIDACRGSVNTPCMNGETMLDMDPERRSYRLRDDPHGLGHWVQTHGARAYQRFLLVDRPGWTLWTFQQQFPIFHRAGLAYPRAYFSGLPQAHDPLALLAREGWGGEAGFLGHDPLLGLCTPMAYLGFHGLATLSAWLALGALLAWYGPGRTRRLSLALALLASGAGQFFLGFFGDGMEIARHVFPATVTLSLGTVLMLVALPEALRRGRTGRRGTLVALFPAAPLLH